MNSIWNKNIELFEKRFPSLYEYFALGQGDKDELPPRFQSPMEVLPAKSGVLTARENGKLLHSSYNPLREAQGACAEAKKQGSSINAACFFSIGLGYAAVSWARENPTDTLIIVEPDASYFFTAMSHTDFSDLFAVPNLMLAIQTGTDIVVNLIEKSGGFSHTAIIENQNQSAHAREYFSALHASIKRAKSKDKINTFTLEKFSRLWMKNACRNIWNMALLDGVNRYEDKAGSLPFVILAAGPTLSHALKHLAALKSRSILVAVDTALRACLRAGVEPDFIVLSDPQFYAYQHIQGLSSKSSILITELSAYPSVFRFPCKEKILMSPFFSLGKYFEKSVGEKGELSSGGSVSTTAWDFARLAGARKIYFAGLDLGFPKLQTHIKGSTFEERMHTSSNRLAPAEKSGVSSLFGANMEMGRDYDGNAILTDNRMKMFSWWFENKALEYGQIESFSFSPQSLMIPGFKTATINEFLRQDEKDFERAAFLSTGQAERKDEKAGKEREQKFFAAYETLLSGLESLYSLAKKGIATCEGGIRDRQKRLPAISELEKIDALILNSRFKDIASLVFPTENQLEKLFSAFGFSQDKTIATLQHSKIIYRELMNGVLGYQKQLPKKN